MIDKYIIYTRMEDGGVSVVNPCRSVGDKHLSNDQIVKRSWDNLQKNKIALGVINPKIINKGDIPDNRIFRDAWVHGNSMVAVDMGKARDIHMDRIRSARNTALALLDVETIKAVGQADTGAIAIVEAQKQVLRDIPQTIDLTKAKTPEELAAIWPEELTK